MQAIQKLGGPLGTAILGSLLSSAYLGRVALSGLPAAAATAARQSIFGAVAIAHEIHSRALLDSARMAFVHGMDLALLAAGCDMTELGVAFRRGHPSLRRYPMSMSEVVTVS